MLTFELHSDFETLLKTAVRTSLPLGLVDVTVSIRYARVHLFILYSPFEEAFAALARQQTVMVARHFITTNGTQLFHAFLRVGGVLLRAKRVVAEGDHVSPATARVDRGGSRGSRGHRDDTRRSGDGERERGRWARARRRRSGDCGNKTTGRVKVVRHGRHHRGEWRVIVAGGGSGGDRTRTPMIL